MKHTEFINYQISLWTKKTTEEEFSFDDNEPEYMRRHSPTRHGVKRWGESTGHNIRSSPDQIHFHDLTTVTSVEDEAEENSEIIEGLAC